MEQPVSRPLRCRLFLLPKTYFVVALPYVFGVCLFLLIQAVRFLGRAQCDIVVLRAKLLPRHNRLIAAAAKSVGKVRLHSLCLTLPMVFAAYFKQALYAVRLSLCCFFSADYAQSHAFTLFSSCTVPFPCPLHEFLPFLLVQRAPVSLVLRTLLFRTLRAERLVRFCVFFTASCADAVFFSPMVCISSVRATVCALVKAHRPSPHRINSGVDGWAILLDLLRCESPTSIGVTKDLDKLLHACCLCHKATSSYCASISTHLHILT